MLSQNQAANFLTLFYCIPSIFPTDFSENPKRPYKVPAGTKVLPQEISNAHCYNTNERGTESQDSSRCDGIWGGDLYRDHSKNAIENGSSGEEMPQSLGHAANTQWGLPSLRRRQVSHISFAWLWTYEVFFLALSS